MLKRLILNNFKSHRHTEIDFNDEVTVIGGPSDQGKSIIITALAWILLNERTDPKPWFKHEGEPTVTLILDDGTKISRGKSWYRINDGEELKNFRSSVPAPVAKILNVSELNLQPQDEFYFLLQQTPGQVAKKVNDFTSLSEMSLMTSAGKKDKKRLESRLKELESRRTAVEKEIGSLEWIARAEKALDKIARLDAELDMKRKREAKVSRALHDVKVLEDQLSRMPELDISGLEHSAMAFDALMMEHARVMSVLAAVPAVPDPVPWPGFELPDRSLVDAVAWALAAVPAVPDPVPWPGFELPDRSLVDAVAWALAAVPAVPDPIPWPGFELPDRSLVDAVARALAAVPAVPDTSDMVGDFQGLLEDYGNIKEQSLTIKSVSSRLDNYKSIGHDLSRAREQLDKALKEYDRLPICKMCGGTGIVTTSNI